MMTDLVNVANRVSVDEEGALWCRCNTHNGSTSKE